MLTFATRGKAVNTLLQRASSLSQYICWATASHPPAIPIDEAHVFAYLRTPELLSKGATNGTRLVEALGFASAVFGLNGAQEAATSSRVKGAALDRHLEKAARRPADPLTDIQLYAIERFLNTETEDEHERIGSGALLFFTYCRCRASDSFRIRTLITDRVSSSSTNGFVEAGAMRVKNAKGTDLKTSLLPLTGFLAGVGHEAFGSWWDTFLKVRSAAGLEPLIQSSESDLILWPKVCTDGSYAKIQCTPDDHSRLLRISFQSRAGA